MKVEDLLLALHGKDLTLKVRVRQVGYKDEEKIEESVVRHSITLYLCDEK